VRKILTIVAVIACLLFQGGVVAGHLPDVDAAVHAASHAGAPHHHDESGSTHYDDSRESLQHMQADHAGFVAGPAVEAPMVSVPALGHALAAIGPQSPPPDPFLEGPHRPPRPAS
jgi:hypothetical protein